MKRKKLGREYKNTCLAEFPKEVNPHKLLLLLERLDMIDNNDIATYWKIKECSMADPSFAKLCDKMNDIAPVGCHFEIRNRYQKMQESTRLCKYSAVGFYC